MNNQPYENHNEIKQEGYVQSFDLPFEYFEKKAVKATGQKIGAALLFFLGISLLAPILIGVISGVIGNTQWVSDPFIILGMNIFLTLIGFLGGGILLLKITKEKGLIAFGLPKKGYFFSLFIMGLGFCYMSNILVSLIQSNLSFLGELKNPDVALPEGFNGFLFSVLSVAVFPAILEEFFFRGAIMGSLRKFGKDFAIFTSAALFGLIHGNLVQIPFAFLVGIILGYAVSESGSIWTGIAIHFANNFLSVCFDYIKKLIGENVMNNIYNIIILLAISFGFLGLYLLCRKNKNIFIATKTPHISSGAKRFWWIMGTGLIIAVLVFVVFEILANQFLV